MGKISKHCEHCESKVEVDVVEAVCPVCGKDVQVADEGAMWDCERKARLLDSLADSMQDWHFVQDYMVHPNEKDMSVEVWDKTYEASIELREEFKKMAEKYRRGK